MMPLYYKSGYDHVATRVYEVQTKIYPEVPIIHRCYSLSVTGLLTLNIGFAWDGATWCPEWLVTQEASGPHDALCQMMREGLLDYVTCAPLVHGLLREMVVKRKGAFVGAIVYRVVTAARGGHPSHVNENPELCDPC